MELEHVLLTLLIMQTLGMQIFKRFEAETAIWRSLLKWTIIIGGTVGLYFGIGGWAILFPLLAVAVGSVVHVVICRQRGFHPIFASPRKEYYAYRGWAWPPK